MTAYIHEHIAALLTIVLVVGACLGILIKLANLEYRADHKDHNP
jgi:hypothetical protein